MVSGTLLLLIFLLSIGLILLSIIKFKLNPFITLLVAGILTGLMVRIPIAEIPKVLSNGFGSTLGGIGIIIGLGVVLGQLLAEANATDQIADSLLKKTGDKKAPLAMNIAGFLVSIPVFFDAAFVIFAPLIKQLSRKTKMPYIAYLTSLVIGLIVTHAVVIPTPGPVAVANAMGADFGIFLLYSLLVAIPAALVGGYFFGSFLGKKNPAVAELTAEEEKYESHADNRPGIGLSLTVLLLPVILILLGSIFSLVIKGDSAFKSFWLFIGDKNIALTIAVLFAMIVLKPYIKRNITDVFITAIAQAGMIFMITGAGGAYGNMIKATGIGDFLVGAFQNVSMPMIILAFLLSQILRAATGSTTVALVTPSGILGTVAAEMGLSPVLIGLAICAGGIGLSLPNDSGFWVVSRYGNLSVSNTMKAWTLAGTIAGVTALIGVIILSFIPLPGLM